MQSSSARRAEGEEKEPRVEVDEVMRFVGVRGWAVPEEEARRPETERWEGVAIVGCMKIREGRRDGYIMVISRRVQFVVIRPFVLEFRVLRGSEAHSCDKIPQGIISLSPSPYQPR